MGATATLRDPLLPRQPGGMAGGAALAIGVHAALVVALAAAVNWRTQAVDVVASAELWAALPQSAAPPPAPTTAAAPAPPPAPVVTPPAPAAVAPDVPRIKPDIAVERERDRARDKARAEREEREAAAAKAKANASAVSAAEAAKTKAAETAKAAATAAAEESRLAAQRAENLRRMMGQAGSGPSTSAATATGSAARDAAPSGAYIGRLVAAIRTNIVFTSNPPGNPTAEVEVRAGPSGTILSRRLVKPSGVAEWDEAVLRAIDRTAALPRDTDGRVPPVLLVAFRMRE